MCAPCKFTIGNKAHYCHNELVPLVKEHFPILCPPDEKMSECLFYRPIESNIPKDDTKLICKQCTKEVYRTINDKCTDCYYSWEGKPFGIKMLVINSLLVLLTSLILLLLKLYVCNT